MTSLESLLEPLRHSPQLPEAVSQLQQQIEAERQRRERFYEEMTPEQKIEFIDGEVIVQTPARNRHLDVSRNLTMLLTTHVGLHKLGTIHVEKCLCVFPRNDYEPDIVFFGPEKTATLQPETVKFPVPDLIVEVLSPSTEARDRGVKFEDYAVNGVGEYWIVNADEGCIEQYLLREQGYHLQLKSSSGQLKSEVIQGLVIPIEAIFKEQANLQAVREMIQSE